MQQTTILYPAILMMVLTLLLYVKSYLDNTKALIGTIPTSTNSLRIAEANINNNKLTTTQSIKQE